MQLQYWYIYLEPQTAIERQIVEPGRNYEINLGHQSLPYSTLHVANDCTSARKLHHHTCPRFGFTCTWTRTRLHNTVPALPKAALMRRIKEDALKDALANKRRIC